MKKVHWGTRLRVMFAMAVLCGFLTTANLWRLKAQEQPVQTEVVEEFTPDLEQESDLEFVQSMDLLEDSELLEMLISDTDFLDVLDEFGENIGIEEEEVPYELLEESDLFSEQIGEMERAEAISEEGRVK